MNRRAAALALTMLSLPMAALAQSPPAAGDQAAPLPAASRPPGPSTPPDPAKQKRLDTYQDRRLIFEQANGNYGLRQGPDPIYDSDFVELMADPALTRFWLGERNKDYGLWIGSAAVGLPAGMTLFYQNFFGSGPLAPFGSASHPAVTNAGDPRAYALSVLGLAIAGYGLYNLSNWALEELDRRHPNRLDADSIAPRVRDFNETLRDRLGLDPDDIPAPPTPRPSVSPSGLSSSPPSPNGFPEPTPFTPRLPDYPEGNTPPALPRAVGLPSEAPSPGAGPAEPVPSVFKFPGPAAPPTP